jgi:hypothetical protein
MIETQNIIILGGGSAGWMTASTLINRYPEKNITVIESPNTPITGVGESTLALFNDWLAMIGIEDEDFMPHTDASYKLSIKFTDFYKKGESFHYPFGSIYTDNLSLGHRNWFYKEDKLNDNYAKFLYSIMALVDNNTITKNIDFELPQFDFKRDTAYHFDAIQFATWLRENYCKPRGVNHIVEDITDIKVDDDGIVSLNNYEADLYFDCTGFKSVLMEKLDVKFNSYNDLLPNNKAWATRVPYTDKEKELEPYTNCTAIENGWVWNIPTWERIGTGYVYSDKYISDEEALDEFKRHLDSKGLDHSQSEFKNIPMRIGLHEDIFVKNVCAIGLSAGFIEPLESNGLLTVHEFLKHLICITDRNDKLSSMDILSFNKACKSFFNQFADFVAAHFALSHRDDTQYWKDISKRDWLKLSKVDSYGISDTMDIFMQDWSFFNSSYGIHCISTGMNYYGSSNSHIEGCKRLNSTGYEYPVSHIEYENSNRDSLVKQWNIIGSTQPSLLTFVSKIHENKQ